jgi:hypothetical protein
MSHKTLATVAFIFLTLVASTSASFAQSSSCTAAPTAPANAAASVTSPGTARVPALVTVQWLAAALGPNAATSYIVEVGNEAGVTNISQFDTGETALSTVQPAAAGTYYVRVRSVNACGKSAPSPEPVVTVTDSIAFGDAGARRIAGFYFSDSEGYVGTYGIVRGAWGARPAPFVRLDSSFQDSDGNEIATAFGYANGRSRRLATSRIITDTTLGSGETGCYIVFSDVPYKSVARVLTFTSWSTSELEPLQGSVVTQSVQSGAGTVGEAKIQGQVRNIGTAMTYFNQVMIALYDTANNILDCDLHVCSGQSSADSVWRRHRFGAFTRSNWRLRQLPPSLRKISRTHGDLDRVGGGRFQPTSARGKRGALAGPGRVGTGDARHHEP